MTTPHNEMPVAKAPARAERRFAPPTFDPEAYRHLLEDEGGTREEQDELLRTLWEIMYGFARMGWGLEPAHKIFGRTLENAWRNAQDAVEQTEP